MIWDGMDMLTFLDSNVLISAATGRGKHFSKARSILADRTRTFASSPFVRLETVPKAVFHKQNQEIVFYDAFFSSVSQWVVDCNALAAEAEKVGSRFGLSMGDALHVAAALMVGADEFVTAERPTSPFKNVQGVTIISIYTP
ncbi:MAG TPA: type II toxin-antitoxin system VapC family toxin [Blastocatellia bacterium]|nr:type II toxin-antitoxin system VapC family toxin [Blastocatellia bacterium]HMX25110.1 type II toxin-antitoxin system VapC family toxin [Blastocatellia bacterium]